MNSVVKKILLGLVFAVLFIGVWNLFDFIYVTVITRGEYQFTVIRHLVYPLALSVVLYIVLFLIGSKKKK